MTALIATNALVGIFCVDNNTDFLYKWVEIYTPICFVLFMATILLVAIIRVYRILKEERMVLLNEKAMTLHASLLFILAAALFLNYFSYFINFK